MATDTGTGTGNGKMVYYTLCLS